ncbi:low molecular weight protein arginine phosphatase [Viridibacillus sp. YIM B01967]|uniref:Low molecular weight protein arginine phosphatase n=1 Tax=Viridibacillus soli TaxID=2798301 RepID=A0ABS1H8A7_9BACL|nr:low molecular weight protein arginine phosphatase [Viridibacillus soli]MBK3495641.1 low molecular weight protein arginine phosphatase [Viridibacillus soli]
MNIYFICTGNTCRSPMAAAILKARKLDGVVVRSAGIYAMPGGGISENAKMVLTEQAIVFEHVSQQIEAQDLQWANLILTMTSAHKEMILQAFPSISEKIFTLKEYIAPYGSYDVSDPFGGDVNIYRQTFQELNKLIDALETKLSED